MQMRALVGRLCVTLLAFASFGLWAEPTPENGVTAHRGDSWNYPEKSLAAFYAANAMGADWIETDVYLTKDGELVATATSVNTVAPVPASRCLTAEIETALRAATIRCGRLSDIRVAFSAAPISLTSSPFVMFIEDSFRTTNAIVVP